MKLKLWVELDNINVTGIILFHSYWGGGDGRLETGECTEKDVGYVLKYFL